MNIEREEGVKEEAGQKEETFFIDTFATLFEECKNVEGAKEKGCSWKE